MSTKIFNARFQFKGDTLANWQAANPVLLDKELAIVIVPAETGAVPQEPAVLFKVGDGTTVFKDLPFVSAKAADVYNWAKAAAKPSYTAAEISGLADYIAGEIQDTDTQYKLEQDDTDGHVLKLSSKAKNATEWAVVATITTVDTVYDDTELAGKVTALEGLVGSESVATQIANAIAALKLAETYATKAEVKAVSDKIGEVAEGKTVVQMIDDAKTAATYDDTALAGRVTTLEGSDAGKSVRTISAEEATKAVNDFAAKVSDDGVVNSFKELVDWVATHGDEAAEMAAAIQAIEAVLAGIGGEGEKPTVVAYVTDAIAALKIGDYAKAADLTALAARVTAAEGKLNTLIGADTVDGSVAKALKDAKAYTDEKDTAMDGRMDTVEGKAHEHANKTALDGITAEKVTAWDTVGDKANDADLATVAKSGDVKDLTQAEGDVIIFNCGSATTVI